MKKKTIIQKQSNFKPGDIVCHKTQGYRAIIVDIDPIFQPSGHYYPKEAIKRGLDKRQPWCKILIDQSQQESYVEECQLILDNREEPISNPKLTDYLIESQGQFLPRRKSH
jgi:heat shock protein HspQ